MAKIAASLEGLEPVNFEAEAPVETTEAAPVAEPEQQPAPEAELSEDQLDKEFETSFLETLEAAQEGKELPEESAPEPEPKAEEEVDSPAAANFKKIKQERDNVRNERDSVKAELEELRAKLEGMDNSDVNTMLEDIKKERDYMSEQLKMSNLERHPEFQQKFQNKIDQIVSGAKAAVGEEYAARMGELVAMNESAYRNQQIEEIMVELTSTQQARMGALLTRMDEVRADKDQALKDADLSYSQLMERQNAEAEAAIKADDKVFNNISSEFADTIEAFTPRDGDDSWNDEVRQRVDSARKLFSGKSTKEEIIEAVHWASAGPHYYKKAVQLMELNNRLRGKNKDIADATPTATTSDTPPDSSSTAKTFDEQFAEMTGMSLNGS